MRETMSSISPLPMVFFCLDFGRMRCAAPASSITSIALSGRWRSVMKRADSSAAAVRAAAAYLTPWCSSNRDFSPRRICTVWSTDGSTTSIFWKRRDSAASFSKMPRYSVKVVAPIHLSAPDDSAGLSRLLASSVPPDAAPAPISVWISSMNRIAFGLSLSDFSTPLRRCSKSPRYLVPASSAPMSSEYTTDRARMSGTSPLVMRHASPSAIAVLPTPASPTSNGLFLRRRHSTCTTRSTSCSRPISGSILPALASAFRFWVNCSSGLSLPSPASPSGLLSPCLAGSAWSLRMPWLMKLTTSSRVTPCCCR